MDEEWTLEEIEQLQANYDKRRKAGRTGANIYRKAMGMKKRTGDEKKEMEEDKF